VAVNGETHHDAVGEACHSRIGHFPAIIETGELCVNLGAKTAEVSGKRVHLTAKEYQTLELFTLRKGATVTKEMFLDHLYGGFDEPELKIIDVFVCKLRKKLQAATGGEHYIETVWGRGYMLRDPEKKGSEAA
jgi:two-component system cell cycle response regulator CtrA